MRVLFPLTGLLLLGCNGAAEVTRADLDEALSRIEALEAEVVALKSAGEGFDPTALEQRIDGLESRKVVGLIDEALVLNVPEDHDSLAEAMSWLRGYSISGTVRIQIADGTYTSDGVDLGHRDGRRIRITGNTADPSRVVMRFTAGSEDGVYLVRGRSLDGFAGITLDGTGMSDESVGFWVGESAALRCRGPIVVQNFGDGMFASYNASIRCDNATARDNRRVGIGGTRGSSVRVRDGLSEGNGHHGFLAGAASSLDAQGATSRDNGSEGWGSGFQASNSSSVQAQGAVATRNGIGFEAHGASYLDAHGSQAIDNREQGMMASHTSSVATGESAVVNSNQIGLAAYHNSAVTSWGGVEVRNNTFDGVAAGQSSAIDLSGASVVNNGEFGINAFWGSHIVLTEGTTSTGHTYDTNLNPSSDPTATSFVFQGD